jgi:hypothetical protein
MLLKYEIAGQVHEYNMAKLTAEHFRIDNDCFRDSINRMCRLGLIESYVQSGFGMKYEKIRLTKAAHELLNENVTIEQGETKCLAK